MSARGSVGIAPNWTQWTPPCESPNAPSFSPGRTAESKSYTPRTLLKQTPVAPYFLSSTSSSCTLLGHGLSFQRPPTAPVRGINFDVLQAQVQRP